MESKETTYRAIEAYWNVCVEAEDWKEAHALAREQVREELAKDSAERDYDRMILWAERFDNAGDNARASKGISNKERWENARRIIREHGFILSRPYSHGEGDKTKWSISCFGYTHGPYYNLKDAIKGAEYFSRK